MSKAQEEVNFENNSAGPKTIRVIFELAGKGDALACLFVFLVFLPPIAIIIGVLVSVSGNMVLADSIILFAFLYFFASLIYLYFSFKISNLKEKAENRKKIILELQN